MYFLKNAWFIELQLRGFPLVNYNCYDKADKIPNLNFTALFNHVSKLFGKEEKMN